MTGIHPRAPYFIECNPTRFPSGSWKRAKWPYSSVIFVLGTTILPPAGSMRSRDSARSSPAVRAAFLQIYREATGASVEAAEAWADEIEREGTRYVADVFV